ncbi:MAG TPA: FAD-binding oxidoreductase [Streptosporangiaceae bacterium]|nr:FAD-binding oxidoreductase [Streptosporangiaceae bacterium]
MAPNGEGNVTELADHESQDVQQGTASPLLASRHAAAARLRRQYAAIPEGTRVRLAKSTSNLFRFRDGPASSDLVTLDVSAFTSVLEVDAKARTALVGGMTTYEDLVDATLRHGLIPLVVPQLKTITLGGAVSGLGIESTSFRNGLPHESVLEMEILTGDGRLITATPDGQHRDLYRGFPNSYGTLGYALWLKIELEPVTPYVHLKHFRFASAADAMTAIAEIARDGSYQGHPADFLDGTAFGPDEIYLTVAAYSAVAPWRSDYTGQRIYYQSIKGPAEDFLTIRDYLWRWDTDWFWCSRAFGVQHPMVRRLWPRRYRRSDVYRKLVAFYKRQPHITRALEARAGRPEQESVIQDVEIPVERSAEFYEFFAAEVGMSPVWLCPLKLRGDRGWPLYPLAPGRVYVNFGFWGNVTLPPGEGDGYFNRKVEDKVTELDGHKGLYSTSFYTPEEFWRLYNGTAYSELKAAYDPAGRLADLYDKCVGGR